MTKKTKKTIDERLEALTQSVELLTTFHKDNEIRMGQLADAMTKIARILDLHEHRISDLEGN